jgi:pimeloyl-ACP methyl ester carboxylesterase
MSAIECPVLALQGAADEYGSRAQLEAIAAHARAPLRIVLLGECGHAPHLQARASTLAEISRFFEAPPVSLSVKM